MGNGAKNSKKQGARSSYDTDELIELGNWVVMDLL